MKNLISKISLVGFGNILNAGLGVILLTVAAKQLSLDDFGRYALLSSLLVALSKIMDFGTNSNYVAISLTRGHTDKTIDEALITLKLILMGFAAVVATIALIVFRLFTPIIWFVFILGLIGYGINLTLYPFFHKAEKYHYIVLLNTIPALIKGTAAILFLVEVLPASMVNFFGVFSVSMLASAIFLVVSPVKLGGFTVRVSQALTLLKGSISAGISLFITSGFPAVANLVTKLIKGFKNVGIFSLADKVSNIFSLIAISIFTVLLPKNSLRKKANIKYDIKELFFLSAGVGTMSIFAAVVLPVALTIVFGSKFSGSIEILDLLIFASAITAIGSFIENYFFIEGKTTTLAVISISKLAVFLVISLLIVPAYGIVGLAWCQLAVAILATATLFSMSLRFH